MQLPQSAIVLPEVYTALMEPLNEDYAEALLPIGTIPIIDFILKHLISTGVKQIYLVVRKNSKPLTRYITKSIYSNQVSIKVLQTVEQDQISVLKQVFEKQPLLTYPFYLLNGPIITNVDLADIASQFSKTVQQSPQTKYCAVSIMQRIKSDSLLKQSDAPYFVQLSQKNDLLNIQKITPQTQLQLLNFKSRPAQLFTNLQPTGIYICAIEFSQLIRSADPDRTLIEFISEYVQQDDQKALFKVYIEASNQLSARIDCPRTYRAVCRAFLKRYFAPYTSESITTSYQIIKQSIVGNNVKFSLETYLKDQNVIGQNSVINGSVIGSLISEQCTILRGSTVQSTVMMQSSYVGKDCILDECIIMGGAYISDGVVLPRGSIVGTNCKIDMNTVYHAIRCFSELWGSNLSTQQMDENDRQLFTKFKTDNVLIGERIIQQLPPVYIMKQQLRRADYDQQKQMIYYIENSQKPEGNTFSQKYIRCPLQKLQPSIINAIKDADEVTYDSEQNSVDENEYVEEEYEEIDEEQEQTHESNTTYSVIDSTTASFIAGQYNQQQITSQLDSYWIPNYLIQYAIKIANEVENQLPDKITQIVQEKASQWFIRNSIENGFQTQKNQHIMQDQIINSATWTDQMQSYLQPTQGIVQVPDSNENVIVIGYVQQKTGFERQLYNLLKAIINNDLFQQDEIDYHYLTTLRKNLQLLFIQQATNQQAADNFRPCCLKLIMALSMNDTEGLSQDLQLKNKRLKPSKESIQMFRQIVRFLTSVDESGQKTCWLTREWNSDDEAEEAVNDCLIAVFEMFMQINTSKLSKAYVQVLIDFGVLNQNAYDGWLDMMQNIEEKDIDDDITKFIAESIQKWDENSFNNESENEYEYEEEVEVEEDDGEEHALLD
ncbi:Eukaryotic_translation initiation factor 2B epsilon subunit [Hexamita inflata]|uniref:Eukaryotic translation initiation factor 2B epsilon subunit n=1 Tax=Hexamita inflata TaxID=28002 RepID=A0AA86UXM5_9EUKA|nr:Eukaryotic translation initiation factor 2B epsilon subunit [Hexamita inflata]